MNFVAHDLRRLVIVDPRLDDYQPLIADAGESDRVLCFSTGDGALRSASLSVAEIWLINASLPDMSGVSLLSLVRRRWPGARVMLIGDAYSPVDELAARMAGATAYVCKPVCPTSLSGCRLRIRDGPTRAAPIRASPRR